MVVAVAVAVAAAVAAAVATMPTDVRAVGLVWVEQSSTGGDIEQRQNMHAATATFPGPATCSCTIATTCTAGVLSSASRTIPIGTVGSVRRQLTQKRMNEQVLVPRPDHVTSIAAA